MKFRKQLFTGFTLLLWLCTSAQTEYYWIKFKDKNNNGYSVNSPYAFLGAKSIERRQKQHIPVTTQDLPITESYIDALRPNISRLVHRIKWFNLVVVQIDSTPQIDAIRNANLPFIEKIELIEAIPSGKKELADKLNEVVEAADQNLYYPNEYGMAYRQVNMLNMDLVHQQGFRGAGILVSVMDNGFAGVNLLSAFDSVEPRIMGTRNFVRDTVPVYQGGGHGTQVLSCLAANLPRRFLGTAPDASYLLAMTEDNTAEWIMEEYNWAAAAEWADSIGAQIFSTSLGYTTFSTGGGSHSANDLTGNTTLITQAGNIAFSKGILVVTSAGNEGEKAWKYISPPADGDSIMAVGAVDSTKKIAGFTGWGPPNGRIKPNVCAMGSRCAIVSSDGGVGLGYGTSFSGPILAGSAASLWGAFPDKTAREIFDVITLSADSFWSPNLRYGYGVPDFYTAYLLLKTNYNEKIIKYGNDVTVFPNPFSNDLHLSFYSATKSSRKIEIFDLYGRKVFSKEVFMRDDSFELLTVEEARNLAAGEYVLVFNGDKRYVHKIIKAR